MNLLVVDDELGLRKTLRIALESFGHQVQDAPDGSRALLHLQGHSVDLVFLDLRLGSESGLDILAKIRDIAPETDVVVMTAFAAVDTAVEAMRRGAFDYLPKPFTPDQLRLILERSEKMRGLQSEVKSLKDLIRHSQPEVDLQTCEPSFRASLDVAFRVADSDATILLRGESGTGKGVLARAIHERSRRKGRPFVTVHCPSLSADLLESELFGHARGAFTGAVEATLGKVAAAEGGTLFLDEIGELPLPLQPKLLRFLQEKTYERVGEVKPRRGDVRILGATNRRLETDVAAGRFRQDLYYRLNVVEIVLPPLRERRGDILPLAEHLLAHLSRQSGKPVDTISPQAREAICRHTWPGNLRELRNAIERGLLMCRGKVLNLEDLPSFCGPGVGTNLGAELGAKLTLEELEREHCRRILTQTDSLEEAAEILGIDPSTLYRKRKKWGF